MPIICEISGVKICMYYYDHLPPHVHAIGPDFQALVSIPEGSLLAGRLPGKAGAAVVKWVRANSETLIENWRRARNGEPLFKIPASK